MTYRWHSSLALEPPPYSIVDTLGFPPAWVNAHEPVALVTVEALCAWNTNSQHLILLFLPATAGFKAQQAGYASPQSGLQDNGRTLLDDGDVLLCGRHLSEEMLVSCNTSQHMLTIKE